MKDRIRLFLELFFCIRYISINNVDKVLKKNLGYILKTCFYQDDSIFNKINKKTLIKTKKPFYLVLQRLDYRDNYTYVLYEFNKECF